MPHHQPMKVSREVVEKRRFFGTTAVPLQPPKISMNMHRYHDLKISPSSLWFILHELELNRLPTLQRHMRTQTRCKRYEKQRLAAHCRSM